ncbi:hypothetical protein Poli38472_000424 [Pythium oligandrum]|uniref:Uncharacterized protein n=1 Tax=Pythium oligandrum TaxID=41045 RepID=A0A8K1CBX3_PYTOL|nr:hypothetical protein Poli38472_000424 [Pythium oligandrum]|eukprot:TMW60382.1 hypothetical protein Poli38472_000424 [Pythium oligandrum]
MVFRRLFQRMRICRNQPDVATKSTPSSSPATARRTTKSPATKTPATATTKSPGAPTHARAHVRSPVSTPSARKWSATSGSTVSSSSTPTSPVAQGSPLAYLAALVVMVTTMVAAFAEACEDYERCCDAFDNRKHKSRSSEAYASCASLVRALNARDQAAQDVERLRAEYHEWITVNRLTDVDLQAQRLQHEVELHFSLYHFTTVKARYDSVASKISTLRDRHNFSRGDGVWLTTSDTLMAMAEMCELTAKLEEAHESFLAKSERRAPRNVAELQREMKNAHYQMVDAAMSYSSTRAHCEELCDRVKSKSKALNVVSADVRRYFEARTKHKIAADQLRRAEAAYAATCQEARGRRGSKIDLGYAGYDVEL